MGLPTEPELKQRIRAVAAWADEDQRSLADAIGVPYPTVRNYFSTGRKGPPLDKALELAAYVGVPREFILDGWDAVAHPNERAEALLDKLEQRLAALSAGQSPRT